MPTSDKDYFKMSPNQTAYVIKRFIVGAIMYAILAFGISLAEGFFLAFGSCQGVYVNELNHVLIFTVIAAIIGGLYAAALARSDCLNASSKYYNIGYFRKKIFYLTCIIAALGGILSFVSSTYIALKYYSAPFGDTATYIISGIVGLVISLCLCFSRNKSLLNLSCFNPVMGILTILLTTFILSFLGFLFIEASQAISNIILIILVLGMGAFSPFVNGNVFVIYDDWY